MKIRKCAICEKELNVKLRFYGGNRLITDSEDGVCFCFSPEKKNGKASKWVCNICWEEILKYHQRTSKINSYKIRNKLYNLRTMNLTKTDVLGNEV